jgi:hypothetical protein
MKRLNNTEPIFTRGDLARILNVTPITIANREKRKQYPEPRRDLNGYRIYSLNDIFNLQLLTHQTIDPRPILSVLYDRGHRDMKELGQMVDSALSRRRGLG